MHAFERTIRLAGGVMGGYYHACGFFHGRDEAYRVVVPFLRDAVDQGERAIHITDPAIHDDDLRRLEADGIDVVRLREKGQLQVLNWDDAYLRGGVFSPDAMLDLVDETLTAGAADGFPGTRIVGFMEWALEDRPGVNGLLEYEARVNDVLAKHRGPAVCVYDVTRFGAETMVDILRTHPLVVIGGTLRENPFFVQPAEYLQELAERRSRTA